MERLLVDSSVLISRLGTLDANHGIAQQFFDLAISRQANIAISVLTLWELEAAVLHPVIGPTAADIVGEFVGRLKVLPLTVSVYKSTSKRIELALSGADRAIVSNALFERRTLISADRQMLNYAAACGARAQHPRDYVAWVESGTTHGPPPAP